jgi:hypothetical protein
MLFGTSNFDRQMIIDNTVALAKATKVFNIPVVLSSVESKSFSGYMLPPILSVLEQEPIERTSMNFWDDQNFVSAIQKTGPDPAAQAAHDRPAEHWHARSVELPLAPITATL